MFGGLVLSQSGESRMLRMVPPPGSWTLPGTGAIRAQAPPRYSWRRATMGSTRMARRAGTYAAASVTSASRIATAANVSGSVGRTSKSSDLRNRPSASAPAIPGANPSNTNFADSERISCRISPRAAPSATRIPTSRVRLETEQEITPTIPAAARISASAPNRLSRNMPSLGCATDADRASIIDSMSVTGRSLSMLRTSCRIVFAALDVLSVVLATTTAPQNGACAYGTYIMGPGSWCNETSRTSPTIPTISRQDAQTHRARATFFRPRASDTTLRLPVTDPEAAHPDLPSELKI